MEELIEELQTVVHEKSWRKRLIQHQFKEIMTNAETVSKLNEKDKQYLPIIVSVALRLSRLAVNMAAESKSMRYLSSRRYFVIALKVGLLSHLLLQKAGYPKNL